MENEIKKIFLKFYNDSLKNTVSFNSREYLLAYQCFEAGYKSIFMQINDLTVAVAEKDIEIKELKNKIKTLKKEITK